MAQLGQRLIDGAAKGMAEDFFKRFDEEMQRRYPAPVAIDAAATAGSAVTPIVPPNPKTPVWVWVAGVLVLAVVWWLLMRRA